MKRLLFFVGPFLGLLSGSAIQSHGYWLDSRRSDDTVYLLFDNEGPRIETFNLNQKVWGETIFLDNQPTAFHLDSEFLYIGLGQSLYRYNHEGVDEMHMGNFEYDIVDIFSDGDILIVNYSNRSELRFMTLNRSTAEQIDIFSHNGSGFGGTSHSLLRKTLYAVKLNTSPKDIQMISYSNTGLLDVPSESPYHGDYSVGTETYVWPDGTQVMDSSGNIYDPVSLEWKNAFGIVADDIVFAEEGIPVVLSGDTMVAFDESIGETGRIRLNEAPREIFIRGDEIVYLIENQPGLNESRYGSVLLSDFKPLEPVEKVSPVELHFMPDDTFISKDGFLNIFSKDYSSLFRWDIESQSWSDTIPLLERTRIVEYSPVLDAVFTADDSNKVFKMDFAEADPREVHFANLSGLSTGLVACGEFLVTSDTSRSRANHYYYNEHGELLQIRRRGYPLTDGQWNEVHRRIYHFRDGISPNDLLWELVNESGMFEDSIDSPYHDDEKIRYPIRVKPDGSIVLLGSGQMYDPVSLETQGTLPETLVDATWISGRLFTLHESKVKTWELPTYAEGASQLIQGQPVRLVSTESGHLVLVRLTSGGLPMIDVLDSELNLVPPSQLQTPLLVVDDFSISRISLSWSYVQGAQSFHLERQVEGDPTWQALGSFGRDVYSYEDEDVQIGVRYNYRLAASSVNLFSDFSESVAAGIDLPGRVTGFSGSAVSENSIRLNWDPVPSAEKYLIQSQIVAGNWIQLAEAGAESEDYLVIGLSRDTEYTFRIIASNDIGNSAPSEHLVIRTPVNPPQPPTSPRLVSSGIFEATFSWGDVGLETGYRLERKILSNPESEWSTVAELGMNVTSYTDRSLAPSTSYLYRVIAFNPGGQSPPSEFSEFATLNPGPPQTPDFRREVIPSINVRLVWDPVLDARQYVVLRRITGSEDFEEIAVLTNEELSYLDQTTVLYESYDYAVLSRNEFGDSRLDGFLEITITGQEELLADDFEDGEVQGENWQINSGSSLAEGGLEGSVGFLYFNGGVTRMLVTKELPIRDGGTISFDLRAGNLVEDGSAWDNSEPGEEVVVEYKVDDVWVLLEELDTVYPLHSSWVHHELSLPIQLDGLNVQFRWRQKEFNSGMDHWGLDNIRITTRLLAPPAPPELLTVVEHYAETTVLFWLPSAYADFYIVERRLESGSDWDQVAVVRAPFYHWEDNVSIQEGMIYRVSAGNAAGISDPSHTAPRTPAELSPLEQWRFSFYGSATNEGAGADDSIGQNGLPNLVSFAFGISPETSLTVFDPEKPLEGGKPFYEFNRDTGRMKITFLRRTAETVSGLTYQIQTADQLGDDWETAGAVVGITPVASGWEMVEWEEETSSTVGSRLIRFSIQKN